MTMLVDKFRKWDSCWPQVQKACGVISSGLQWKIGGLQIGRDSLMAWKGTRSQWHAGTKAGVTKQAQIIEQYGGPLTLGPTHAAATQTPPKHHTAKKLPPATQLASDRGASQSPTSSPATTPPA